MSKYLLIILQRPSNIFLFVFWTFFMITLRTYLSCEFITLSLIFCILHLTPIINHSYINFSRINKFASHPSSQFAKSLVPTRHTKDNRVKKQMESSCRRNLVLFHVWPVEPWMNSVLFQSDAWNFLLSANWWTF